MRLPHFLREAKWFLQRGKRGWGDCDPWWMSSHLSRVIADMAKSLRENGMGHYCVRGEFQEGETAYDHAGDCLEEWNQYLQKIEFGFRYWLWVDEVHYDVGTWQKGMALEENANKIVKMACELLGKHFGALWD